MFIVELSISLFRLIFVCSVNDSKERDIKKYIEISYYTVSFVVEAIYELLLENKRIKKVPNSANY